MNLVIFAKTKSFFVSSNEWPTPLAGDIWALVPAAGQGARMAANLPKQYLSLGGEPLLLHTLRRLASHPRVVGMAVVISADDTHFTTLGLSEIEAQLTYPLVTVTGGSSRSESVVNGAQKIAELIAASGLTSGDSTGQTWLLVHDAARPCVRHGDIDDLIAQVDDQGGLLSAEVTDTLWRQGTDGRCEQTLPREQLRRALTPQLFPLVALSSALVACHKSGFQPTDEAEAMRRAGFRPRLVMGSADNIKVTRAGDLELAEFFLQRQAGNDSSGLSPFSPEREVS